MEQQQESRSLWQAILAKRAEMAREQPSLAAEIKAMGREAAKDVHNTLNQMFFGTHAGVGEPGAPLNPTPQMVTQDLGAMGKYQQLVDGFSTKGPTAQLHDKDRGMER